MAVALYVVTVLLAVISLLPRTGMRWWYVVLFEYLRFQVFVLCLLCLAAWCFYGFWESWWQISVVLALTSICIWHFKRISAYLPFSRKEVKKATGNGMEISCLISNVYQPNEERGKLKGLIRQYKPDMMLLVEVDAEWISELTDELKDYRYRIEVPFDNTYGMAFYSKFHISGKEVRYRVKEQMPSIVATVQFGKGLAVKIHGVHPIPPAPGEAKSAIIKDKELVKVAQEVNHGEPTIVMGDLNDVAWSKTTRLFQKISGLLDPRKGRQFLSTFHAKVPLLRFPLDHVFISRHFKLVELKRLPDIGSDHFPVLIRVSYNTNNSKHQKPYDKDDSAHSDAAEIPVE